MGDEVHPVGWLRLSLRMFPGPITRVPVHRSTAAFSNPARCSDSELTETRSPSSTSRRTSFHLRSNDEFRHRLVSTARGPVIRNIECLGDADGNRRMARGGLLRC
jgi:hypothetical protein